MKQTPVLLSILFLLSGGARAASFVVPPDEVLIREADAIAVATVLSSWARQTPSGGVETVTELAVEEPIKGSLATGRIVTVVELGGVAGDIGLLICGAAEYEPGERALVFLRRQGEVDSRWRTLHMTLGKFDFEVDAEGRRILMRLPTSGHVFGWDMEGEPFVERPRASDEFLQYVRRVTRGESPEPDYFLPAAMQSLSAQVRRPAELPSTFGFPPWTYQLASPGGVEPRWNTFPTEVVWRSNGTLANAPNGGVDAIIAASALWTNDPDSNVNYTYGGTTTSLGGLKTFDSINSVLFNDPNDEIPGEFTGSGTLAIGGPWFSTSTTHLHAGFSFGDIFAADIVLQDRLGIWPGVKDGRLIQLITHEEGHTLGFRHSDQGQRSSDSCLADFDCSNEAIMKATITTLYSDLQPWDRRAVAALYGDGAVAPPPCITLQSQPNTAVINEGESVTLSVSAKASSGGVSYQWFRGERGDTSQPVGGATGTSFQTGPVFSSRSYWVRVTAGCGTADSVTARVLVGASRSRPASIH